MTARSWGSRAEWVAAETGIPAEDIRTLAREYATAQPSTIAALQGGYLVSSAKRDIRPMRYALAAAPGQLKSYAPVLKESR